MLELMARAICREMGCELPRGRRAARLVLKVVRTPSEDMVAAGAVTIRYQDVDCTEVWQAMIDAAFADPT